MIKTYQIPLICRNASDMQNNHQKLRKSIQQGDLSAVEKLSQLKQQIGKLLTRIDNFIDSGEENQLKIYLYGAATSLRGIISASHDFSKINEKQLLVPWIRQRSNKSQFNTVSQHNKSKREKNSTTTSKQVSIYQTKQNSQFNSNILSSSNKSLSNSKSYRKDKSSQCSYQTSQKSNSRIQNKNQNARSVSPFSRKSSSKKINSNSQFMKVQSSKKLSCQTDQDNLLQRCLFGEPNQGVLRIKITQQQLQEIMKLKKQLKR